MNGNVSRKTIEVESDSTASTYSAPIYEHKIAVVIGINKYNPWPGLEYAVNDAKAVRESLERMGYDKVILFRTGSETRRRSENKRCDRTEYGKKMVRMIITAGGKDEQAAEREGTWRFYEVIP